jgi:hypothetical protein
MEHYVTLFDSLFLPQGLALHASLERHAGNYLLWVLCVDNAAHEALTKIALPNIRLLHLEDIETADLQRVRGDRTAVEYCWTLTPYAPRFVFEADPSVNRVTYLDADMWLRKSPLPIFRELDATGKSVLITNHAYAPEYDQSATSGQFCVQFMVFQRHRGENVRKWWEEHCIAWCYARLEDGKFGDQKYLDDWPERFPDEVHVLQVSEWMLGPWNTIRFPYSVAIWHHFHGLRVVNDSTLTLNNYAVPPPAIEYLYKPYSADIKEALTLLRSNGFSFQHQANPSRKYKVQKILSFAKSFFKFRWRFAPNHTLKF